MVVDGRELPEGARYVDGIVVPEGMRLVEEEIASGEFAIGPVDAPPASSTSAAIPFTVLERAHGSRIVLVGEATGQNVGFTWTGPGDCAPYEGSGNFLNVQVTIAGRVSEERACGGLAPGESEVIVEHATGSMTGTITVYGSFLRDRGSSETP